MMTSIDYKDEQQRVQLSQIQVPRDARYTCIAYYIKNGQPQQYQLTSDQALLLQQFHITRNGLSLSEREKITAREIPLELLCHNGDSYKPTRRARRAQYDLVKEQI